MCSPIKEVGVLNQRRGVRVGQLAFSYQPTAQAVGATPPGHPGDQWLDDIMQPLWRTRSCGGEVPRTQSCRQACRLWGAIHRVHHHRLPHPGGDRCPPPRATGHPLRHCRGAGSGHSCQQSAPQHRCRLTTPPVGQHLGPPRHRRGGPSVYKQLPIRLY